MSDRTLWLIGYGAWPATSRGVRLVEALRGAGVSLLVDTRHSPCSSDRKPGTRYGPRPWHVQEGDAGIVSLLQDAGISYEWLVELGNPQRLDPEMTVLKSQLNDPLERWPIHRGLARLDRIVRESGKTVALLCACEDGRACHRTVVANALRDRYFSGELTLREVSAKS